MQKLTSTLLAILAGFTTAHAANVSLTASDPGGTSSLNSAGKWSDLAAPSAANDYFTGAFFVRTPPNGLGMTFAGNSLTLQQVSGQGIPMRSILYKGTGGDTIIINNLTNAVGGVLNNGGSGNVAAPTFTGNLWTIAGNSTVLSDQGSIIIGYPLAGSAILTNASDQGRTITYTGNLAGFTGKFFINRGATVALNSGSSNLGNPAVPTPDQITISAGCGLLDNVGLTFNNANSGITLLGSGAATINTAGNTIISEPITDVTNAVSSVSSLTKAGVGTLTLNNAANSWSGGTTISAGTLQIGVANALPVGNLTDNGILDLNGINTTVNGLSGSGSVDTLSGGTPTLTVGVNGGGGTLSGVIQNSAGTLSLTKVGAGTLTLAGGYAYSGTTLVAGGTLNLATTASLPGAPGNLVVSNGATLAVNASGGTPLPANNLVVGTNSTLNATLNSAAVGFNVAGSLTFQDNATNTFNYGTLSANPTALAINASGSISAPGANIVINVTGLGFQTGTFALIQYTGAALGSIANFSLNLPPGVAGTLVNNTANKSIDINIASIPNQLAWNGASGTSWDLTTANWKNILTLGTTVFQQYTNGSVIAGDTVVLDDTLYNDFINPQPTNINLTAKFFVFPLTVDSTLPYSISGAGGIIGSTSLVKSNTGSLTLSTSNSYTGGTYVYGGSLVVNNDSALGATSGLVTLSGGDLSYSGNSTNNVRPISLPVASSIGVASGATARLGGVISGAGTLRKVDAGTMILTASNTYAGSTFVKGGTLVLESGAVMTSPAGMWDSIGQDGSDNGTMTLKGTAIVKAAADFNVGDIDAAVGTLNIQDTAVLGANSIFIASANNAGSTAVGTVNQTGGSVFQTNNAVGTFAVGGRLSASGVGIYNQSGGTVTATAGIRVGGAGTGTYNLNGGTLIAMGGINVARLAGSTGTFNLNGGLFQTLNIASSTGSNAVINLNGGTIVPTTNAQTTTFFQGLSGAFVRNGATTIDSSNLNLTIGQALLHSTNVADAATDGGLTKKGAGTLTLSGVNTFTGPITNAAGTLVLNSASTYVGDVRINAGTVQMTTASIIQGTTVVSNNATLSILQIGSATASISNLTLNGVASGSGATLGLTIATGNNPTVPLVNCGTLTLNGTNTISLAAVNVGTMALVKYVGALAGSGNCTNISLPQGATGYVSNNVANSTLYAVITSTGPGLVWTGTNSVSPNVWNIGVTTNWLVGAALTSYRQIITPGDAVTFNDVGSGIVSLNTNVAPASLVISNVTKSYTFSGSGNISGSTGLLKLGSGAAILNLTNNNYSGNTTISNGTLTVANNGISSALSPSANLVIGSSGALQLSAQLANAVTTVGEFSGAGTLNFTGGNNSILAFGGSVGGTWNGSIQDAGGGGLSLTKSGSGTWVVGGTNRLNNGDFFNAVSQVQFNGGTTIVTNGGLLASAYNELWIAQGAGSTSTVVVAGGTLAVSNNWFCVGRGDASANGTLIVNSGTVIKAGANNLVVGSSGATGALIVNGGQVRNNGMLWLGENATGNGSLQLNGGLVQAMQVRPNNAPVTSIANFNGGTLQASAASADFIQSTAMVQSGGLVLDDGGFVVTLLTSPLQEDGSSPGGGLVKQGVGTVYLDNANTYTGTTTVSAGTLAGVGSISGPVVVGPAGRIGAGNEAGLGVLTLNSKPLTIQGTAALRISKNGGTPASDLITGISTANYGGTLSISNATSDATPVTLGDTFTLFSTAAHTGNFASIVGSPGAGLGYSFNPTTGVLSVVAGTANYPTNITSSVSGNTLSLSWPATHQGWILQTQTNALSVGLNTTWTDVPGSSSVTSMNIPINPANPTVFFRLRNP